jgi:prolyl oligopeptidase
MNARAVAVLSLLSLVACPKKEPAAPVIIVKTTPTLPADASTVVYPEAPKSTVSDTYFGTVVPDPYRWLEDPDSADSRKWIDAENRLTRSWIDAIPERKAISDRLTKVWNYERYSTPAKKGGHYFYTRNDGLQNQAVLYVTDALDAPARVLLDPNQLKADGTVALAAWTVSEDGKLLAWATADGGSDWNIWHVRDIATGKDLPDELDWVKFSGASWTHDNQGFYYERYPVPKSAATGALEEVNDNQTVWYHKVGTPQSADTQVYARTDHPAWGFSTDVSEDGKTLIIAISEGTENKNRIYLQDLTKAGQPIKPVLDGFDAYYTPLGNTGSTWYFQTDNDAPLGRVVAIDVKNPEKAKWKEIIPQSADKLDTASWIGGNLVVHTMHDAAGQATVYDLTGKKLRDVQLPGIGTVSGFGGRTDDPETFYAFTGFTSPTTIYRYDTKTGQSSLFKQAKVDFDPTKYKTEQVFYPSTDGTKIPMFLVYRADLVKNGKTPTLLYGYGGFDISITPAFSVANLVWVEMGGIYAVANLRGGGEYGREWHEQGIKQKKQNVFDDFASAARYLQSNGYTDAAHTAIHGRSNGGLLIGASLTQHPELFGAALPGVGVMDMLRYNKFTIGWNWASDYGTAEDDEAMFKYLLKYSPVHNAKPNKYPPTLITTGDHDDRVVPAHSFKFAAAMQAAQQDANQPILIRIDTRGGHGGGKPTAMLIEELSDQYSFLVRSLGMKLPDSFGK